MHIDFCPHPKTSEDILCFKHLDQHTWRRYQTTNSNFTAKDIKDMFKAFSLSTDGVDEMITEFHLKSLNVKCKKGCLQNKSSD